MIDNGALSPNGADLAIEITRSIESGRVHAEPRSGLNTTPTTLEEFATTTLPALICLLRPLPYRIELADRYSDLCFSCRVAIVVRPELVKSCGSSR